MRAARIFAIAFITGFSGAMMPGPMLVLTIGQVGAHQSMAPVWAIVGGHAGLEIITVLLLMAGLRQVLQRPALRGAVSLIGGVFLAYMGIDMMVHAHAVALDFGAREAGMPWLELMLAGAFVCAINPYFIGWWATIGSGQLAHAAPCSIREYAVFYLGHELSDLVWFALVGLVVVTGATWLSPGAYSWLILVCGGALVLLSLWFMWTGVRFVWLRAEETQAALPTAALLREACAGAGTAEIDPEE
ncbi:MAG: LysE family transporter [Armatimonadota bacterium]